ncbi:MAG: hypothetical protein AAGK02_13600 [Pseudomonadota bacterium]
MLRLLLFLLAVVIPAALSLPLAAQEVEERVIVTGVVRDINTGLPPYGTKTTFTHSIRLAAWRQGDEPVETMVLWISFETETSLELDELGQQFPTGELIRFMVQDGVTIEGETGGLQSANAKFAVMLPKIPDEEVVAAADRLLRPPAIEDAKLGIFEATPPFIENFGQQRDWLGKEILFELILEPLGPNAREHALAMARIAWKNRKTIDAQIREAITDHIYSRRAQEAGIMLVPLDGDGPSITEDELPPLSREDFKADHKLVYVHCSAQDYCSYSYVAQKAGWEWSYWATIRRNEDSWSLDGWAFP